MLKSLTLCACIGATALFAQENPLSASIKTQYMMGRGVIVKAAEKMPESNYAFKPTDDVRSFGQLVGHVANAQYMFCSAASADKSPNTVDVEKTVTAKDDLVKALNDAFTFCDQAYSKMTDAQAMEIVKFFGNNQPKLGILSFNNMHNYEHYGNMVTYLRLKNIVPPSSEPRPQPKKSGE